MSRNGSGIYSLPTGNPVVTGTTITSNWANTTLSDLATAMTGSVASDGQTPITGNLQMGGNKVTGMGPGTSGTDAVNLNQLLGFIEAGTAMLFVQTAAPTGWTKSTTHNNKALRIVSGTASSGGSVAFTTAFSSQNVGDTTLNINQIPAHLHDCIRSDGGSLGENTGSSATVSSVFQRVAADASAIQWVTTYSGGGGSHTHSLNLAVQYVDVIIATKD